MSLPAHNPPLLPPIHNPPLLPPMDFGTKGTSLIGIQDIPSVECTINKRERTKYMNCGVIATRNFFIKDEEVDKYGDNLIPPLTTLQRTITAVPNMQNNFLTM